MHRILVRKPDGKRARRRWEDNIKMNLREIGWGWCGVHFSGSG
jgi:hypothetical protein